LRRYWLLKHVIEGKIEERTKGTGRRESSYFMPLRRREDTGN
jgi:hypothetical protein